MSELAIWEFVAAKLAQHECCALLVVTQSSGSSPGRQGFKMAVARDGEMAGSIGGGIMEHKLVAYVRDRLQEGTHFWELRRQVHSKEVAHDQSGMICSGEQTIAMLCLRQQNRPKIAQVRAALQATRQMQIAFFNTHLEVAEWSLVPFPTEFQQETSGTWQYREVIGYKSIAHVIGAGHVGLAMCRVLQMLDFYVINYDDRPNLNTMQANAFADKKIVVPYPEIGNYIPESEDAYVIVMTFGYRGDDQAVRALIGRKFRYFGMMGSQAKVDKLLSDLRKDGYPEADIKSIRTPAGLVSHCKTPSEIAVSIAAEIIAHRNTP